MTGAGQDGALRVGLVGAGMVSQHHVAAWAACPDARLVAIADPDIDRARARNLSDCAVYPSLAAMLNETTLDALDIASPASTHAALVLQAAAAGLPVLCQKPLTTDAESARALTRALGPDPRMMLHENWRWRAPYRDLARALAEGSVPRPLHFDLRVESAGLLPDASGRLPALVRQPFFADLPRFLVFEVLGHHLDVLAFLFGDLRIESVRLFRRCPRIQAEDRAEITLSAGGIPGRLIGDFCTPGAPPLPRDILELDGVRVLDDWTLTLPDQAPRVRDRAEGYQASYDAAIAHFARAITRNTQFETPIAWGAALLDRVDEVYRLGGKVQDQTPRTGWA